MSRRAIQLAGAIVMPMAAMAGGAPNSRHRYGDAADPVGGPSFPRLVKQVRNHGFGAILGPGHPCHPDHNDHTHVDGRAGRSWSAPNRGV